MIVAMFSDQPCETGLGGCFTISCVCANYIWQGYVFMFFVLALFCANVLLLVSISLSIRAPTLFGSIPQRGSASHSTLP